MQQKQELSITFTLKTEPKKEEIDIAGLF